ncbi:type I secretion system permease/ATPase [Marinicauda salina]|uniref:Type I secretion system permease/ATPase n=1 Tax=Marinicauda salina TaxID=2135793 RepID=A0A2U2BX53_9PROT|nr:ATP-binding cassette domain-containing protein [Marinicauda salina]PWE18603.1 type I secretion system permease/ATPase [Marinicauda salina]
MILARELAPSSDAESIARGVEDAWDTEAFIDACRSSGLAARPVSGKPAKLFKETKAECFLLETVSGEWRVARRLDEKTLALLAEDETQRAERVEVGDLKDRLTGRVFEVTPPEPGRAAAGGDAQPDKPREWFWGVIREYRASFVYIAIAGLVINTLALAMPLFIMNVYDRVFPNQAFATLWVLAFGVMAAIGFELVLKLARAGLIDAIGKRVDYRISTRLFEKILNAPLLARREPTGAYISRFNEFNFVRDFFTSATVSSIVDIGFIIIFFGVIALIAGWLVLVPISGFLAVLGLGFILQQLNTKVIEDARANDSARHTMLFETVAALESVKTLGAERSLTRRWRGHVKSGAETNERLRRLTSFGMSASAMVQQLITVGLVVGGAYLFAAAQLSLGAIIAVVMLSSRALAPVGTMALLITRGRQAFSSLNALDRLMELPSEAQARAVSRPVTQARLELREASVRFEGADRDVLHDVTLKIEPGERVGVIGRVGSGKTTLCRLLGGLYPPDAGGYHIDGLDVRQYNVRDVRKSIRLVAANPELFSGTVRENLTLGDASVPNERLMQAAKLSGLLDFLAEGEAGFELDIGERGERLSSGQRRILALARAFVHPFRTLILDEPTANLDNWTEGQLVKRLSQAIAPDQTLIVATHRQPVLELVDRLIVLDNGKVMMDGPRDDVIARLQGRRDQEAAGQAAEADEAKSAGRSRRKAASGKTKAKTAKSGDDASESEETQSGSGSGRRGGRRTA